MKFATYVMTFDQGQWIMRNIENAYPHVDQIYVMHSELPWGYNPEARDTYKNNFDLNIIKQSKYMDKITIIEGDWMSDTDERNACLQRAKTDGYDYLMVQDADEFFFHKDFEKITQTVRDNPQVDVFAINLYAFWKSFKYVIISNDKGRIGGTNQSIVNLRTVDKYDYIRDVHGGVHMTIPDVICYHGSYVLTDEQLYKKIKTWSHNQDFDTDKWYNEIWLPWTLESKNLHPIWPWVWTHCEVFENELPEVIADLKIDKEAKIPTIAEIKNKNGIGKIENKENHGLEITTNVLQKGCVNDCVFCPQNVLLKEYKGERMLSFKSFKMIIDKIPNYVNINFSGFSEPFLNNECADMILYADQKGHSIVIYTTGVGLTIEKINKIKHIKFRQNLDEIVPKNVAALCGRFTLHLPDNHLYAKHPITDQYIETLKYLETIKHEISGFEIMCFGEIHEKIKHIFSGNYVISNIGSRSNTLLQEISYKPELLDLIHLYRNDIRKYSKDEMTCSLGLNHGTLLPNGDVYLCCQDWNLEHKLGNLFIQNYLDILPPENQCFNKCRVCSNGIKSPIKGYKINNVD